MPQEVAELFVREPFFSDDEPVAGEERFLAYGVTAKGRLLTVSFTERNRKIRPITGWDMTRQELKNYAKEFLEPE